RAMLRASEGKIDEAWQDLLACHRLGRHLSHGCTLIEGLVGIAIDAIASNAEVAFLGSVKLSPKQLQACMRDLQALPPMAPLADKIDTGERFMFLDSGQMMRRGGTNVLGLIGGGAPKQLDAKEQKALEAIDWDMILRTGNGWYDRMSTSMRRKDRAQREKELDKIEEE